MLTKIKNITLIVLTLAVLTTSITTFCYNPCWFQGFLSLLGIAACYVTFFNGMWDIELHSVKDIMIMLLAALFIAAIGMVLPLAYYNADSIAVPILVTTTFTSLWAAFTLILTTGFPRKWLGGMFLSAYIVSTGWMLSTLSLWVDIFWLIPMIKIIMIIGFAMFLFCLVIQAVYEIKKRS